VDLDSTTTTCSSSGNQSISSKEPSEELQPLSDVIEIPKFLCRSPSLKSYEMGASSLSSQTGSEISYSICSSGSDEVGSRSSYDSSSSISDDRLPAHTSTTGYSSLLHQQTKPILKKQFQDSSAPFMKRYVPVKTTDGPGSSTMKNESLPTNYSSKRLPDEPEETLLQSSSPHKDIDCESSLPVATLCSHDQATRKLPVLGTGRLATNHQSSTPLLGRFSKSLGNFEV